MHVFDGKRTLPLFPLPEAALTLLPLLLMALLLTPLLSEELGLPEV